jgi:hypothetical protein
VKAIHTGYAGPARGSDNHQLENEMTAEVKHLLAGKASSAGRNSDQLARRQ